MEKGRNGSGEMKELSPSVIVGMSGGVDSSVAAYLLQRQGYNVEGVSFILYGDKETSSGCSSTDVIGAARKNADHINIRHTTLDLRDEFREKVIEPFISGYLSGSTPNPCILCNKRIKFPYLLKIADEKRAVFAATGHYARIEIRQEAGGERQETGVSLKKGVDAKKDQSYSLYVLRQKELNRLKLPLGDKIKDEVRKVARDLKLPASERPESQEICFIENKGYFKFLRDLIGHDEGPIIDAETGEIVGSHRGIYLYTIGQRKRLEIAAEKPFYVVKIDPSKNAIYVGQKRSVMIREFRVRDLNWLINSLDLSRLRTTVKVRSTMKDEPAIIETLGEDRVRVIFDLPQWAPAPGQSAVFYSGDTVIGGGIIS